jgi:hypothetical protein
MNLSKNEEIEDELIEARSEPLHAERAQKLADVARKCTESNEEWWNYLEWLEAA